MEVIWIILEYLLAAVAALSHTLLNEDGVARLEESPIELLITTDSVNNPAIQWSSKIKIISVAPLFAETVDRINKGKSVSPLFIEVPDRVFGRKE